MPSLSKEESEIKFLKLQLNAALTQITKLDTEISDFEKKVAILTAVVKSYEERDNKVAYEQNLKKGTSCHPSPQSDTLPPAAQCKSPVYAQCLHPHSQASCHSLCFKQHQAFVPSDVPCATCSQPAPVCSNVVLNKCCYHNHAHQKANTCHVDMNEQLESVIAKLSDIDSAVTFLRSRLSNSDPSPIHSASKDVDNQGCPSTNHPHETHQDISVVSIEDFIYGDDQQPEQPLNSPVLTSQPLTLMQV